MSVEVVILVGMRIAHPGGDKTGVDDIEVSIEVFKSEIYIIDFAPRQATKISTKLCR